MLSIQENNGKQILILSKPFRHTIEFEVVCVMDKPEMNHNADATPYYIGKRVKVIDRPNHFIYSDIGRKCKWLNYKETYRILNLSGLSDHVADVLEVETVDFYTVDFSDIKFLDAE